jgi:hypothetical protein
VQNSNAAITLILIGIMATSVIGQGLLNKDEEKDSIGKQVLPKDSFPVLNNPKFVDISRAEKKKYVSDNDAVIGIVIDEVAKAYPIKTMGVHELANDTIAGIPLAVTW